jgi:GNAT superfamily N-acetyltransferase
MVGAASRAGVVGGLPWLMDPARQAHAVDRAAVIDAVVAAFDGDPAWSFLHGADYDRIAPRFAATLFDLRVDAGDIWVIDDGAATAMWVPPTSGEEPWPGSESAWVAYRDFVGEPAWARLVEYERAVDAARPSTSYWYLGVLATHPDRQSQGLASAVIAPVLARADAEGLDACLETSTEGNKAFYGRRGFSDVTPVDIAGGPPTWWLRRPAPDRR